jgi:hypothetical protein
MSLLNNPDDIWVLTPNDEDLMTGARYAEITLPWTFNRMMKNTGSRGQQERALNIAKGVVVQEILRRELARRNIKAPGQIKSHRNDDLFDFQVVFNGAQSRLDVKSIHHYSDHDASAHRDSLTPELIIKYAAYAGPDWRYFFPMMIPHTQIKQDKQTYCFAIGSSIDPRKEVDINRTAHVLTAFPSGGTLPFLSSRKLCLAREQAGQGIFLTCSYASDGLFDGSGIAVTIVGEWDGEVKKETVSLKRGTPVSDIGPFSVVSSFQVTRDVYDNFLGRIDIQVTRNDFGAAIRDSAQKNINVVPSTLLALVKSDFCNLLLPSDYKLYVIGWTPKSEFLASCRNYSAWVWPQDSISKYENRPWAQITDKDRSTLKNAGFDDCIQTKPSKINAGWLKTTGKGNGACCYVFPNTFSGGIRETNLYVLPQDLRVMNSLGL